MQFQSNGEHKKSPYWFDHDNHIHTLDGQPLIGTSSMSSVLAKGGLTYWASGLACEKFGWTNSKLKSPEERTIIAIEKRTAIGKLTAIEYLKLLDEAYKAHATKLKDSAKGGIDLHAVMEEYVKWCIEEMDGKPDEMYEPEQRDIRLSIFIDWSVKNVKKFLWSEVHCYSKELWLGGISDCGFEDKDGKIAVLDFKSSKEVYLSQFWQCVAYALELEENGGYTSDGKLLFKLDKPIDYVAVLPFGMDKPEVQFNFDMVGGKEAIKAMCVLYKKLN